MFYVNLSSLLLELIVLRMFLSVVYNGMYFFFFLDFDANFGWKKSWRSFLLVVLISLMYISSPTTKTIGLLEMRCRNWPWFVEIGITNYHI